MLIISFKYIELFSRFVTLIVPFIVIIITCRSFFNFILITFNMFVFENIWIIMIWSIAETLIARNMLSMFTWHKIKWRPPPTCERRKLKKVVLDSIPKYWPCIHIIIWFTYINLCWIYNLLIYQYPFSLKFWTSEGKKMLSIV